VNCVDEHLNHALAGAEFSMGETVDAVFELAGGLLSEREGDDVGRGNVVGFLFLRISMMRTVMT
jgi:hypothetical protein